MDKRVNMAACVMCVFKFVIFDCFTTQMFSPACVICLLPPLFNVLYIDIAQILKLSCKSTDKLWECDTSE